MTAARNERQNPSTVRSKHASPPRSPRANRNAPIIANRTSSHVVVDIIKSPSPPFRGEREGPNLEGWEGEVGGAANRNVGPPHPALSPRPAGVEGKGSGHGTNAGQS